MAGFELKALITAKDRLSPKLSELQKKLKKFRKDNAITGRGALSSAAGLAAGATGSLVAFAQQEEAATDLKVAMMEVGGKVSPQFEKINELALKLGNTLPGTTADFQNMMQMLVRQGIPASNILAGVGKASAYLAVQLKKTPEAAAEFAAKMQDSTGTASKDMMGLFDTIQRAFYLGVDDNNMLSFFAKTSSVIKMIDKDGLKAAKSLSPISVMMDQMGMEGEAAGNAVRKVIQSGLDVKKVRGINERLKNFNIKLDFTDKKGSFGGLDNLFTQLDKLKNLTDVRRTEVIKSVFGDDAETLQVVNALLEKGKSGYDEIVRKMQEQADLNRRVEAQLGTLTNLWEAMTGTAKNGLASIGSAFEDDTKEVIKDLSNLTEKFDNFVKAHPHVVRSIAGIAAALVTLKLGILGLTLASNLFTATPLGRALAVISMAIGALVVNWKAIPTLIKGISTSIKQAMLEQFAYIIIPWHAMVSGATVLWGKIKASFFNGFKYIKNLWSDFHPLDWTKEQFDPLITYFQSWWEQIKPYFEPLLKGIEKIQSRTASGMDWANSEFDALSEKMRGIVLPSITQNPVYTQELNHVGLLDSPLRRDEQGSLQLTVDFRNLPTGTRVQTEGKPPSGFNYDVGYTRFARQ